MKLRLQSNSIRLRLKRGEVIQLAKTGRVEEKIVLGARGDKVFCYVLESSDEITSPQASLTNCGMHVWISRESAVTWATSDEIGIEAVLPAGDQKLQILIEKDFACLNGPEEQNVDTFPNPLAGTKC